MVQESRRDDDIYIAPLLNCLGTHALLLSNIA